MRLRQLTGELRGRDMELGRVLEDKMRLLVEILEEVGVDTGLPPVSSISCSCKVAHETKYTIFCYCQINLQLY